MSEADDIIEQTLLGKDTHYDLAYSADHLFPIERRLQREIVQIASPLPFYGFDIWNAYEVSWLNPLGKPMVAIATIAIPADSEYLIESKSFKLYFNGFNQTSFENTGQVEAIIATDLSKAVGKPVTVQLQSLDVYKTLMLTSLPGKSIDHHEVSCADQKVNTDHLKTHDMDVEETLCSDVLRSLCLATGQPDWASVMIRYKGKKIDEKGLLQHIVSCRNHREFHEHCVERMFVEIQRFCNPTSLTIYARYTRRGGLDINPYRSTEVTALSSIDNTRLIRQ